MLTNINTLKNLMHSKIKYYTQNIILRITENHNCKAQLFPTTLRWLQSASSLIQNHKLQFKTKRTECGVTNHKHETWRGKLLPQMLFLNIQIMYLKTSKVHRPHQPPLKMYRNMKFVTNTLSVKSLESPPWNRLCGLNPQEIYLRIRQAQHGHRG